MRKILTLLTAMLLTVPMWAIGDGSGDSKADAIDFSWENGCEQNGGSKWYRVPLDPLYDEDNPTLALYLTNLDNEEAEVTVTGYIMSEKETREYKIAAKSNQIWSRSAAALVSMKQTEIYLVLESNKKVALSAKVYETSDLDEACLKAQEFKWDDQSMVQPAGNGWWAIDLTEVKANPEKTARLVITNMGNSTANYTVGISPDCPSSGLTEKSASLAVGANKEEILKRALIDMLGGQFVYVFVSTNQPLNLFAELVDKPAPTEPAIACDAKELKMDVNYTQAKGEQEYRIPVAELKGKKMMPEVTLINTSNAGPAKLTAKVAFACGTDAGSTDFMEYSYTVDPGKTIVRDVEKNMVDGIKDGVEYIYVRLKSTQDIAFSARLKNVHEGDACKTSTKFDWVNGHVQNTPNQVWYAVGIKDAKNPAAPKNIHLFVENNATTKATIKADLAFSCPYVDLQSITRSVEGGKSLDKVLDYSLFSALADTIYVGITADKKVYFHATLEDATHTPSFPNCDDKVEFDWEYGVKQAANVPGGVLYRVDIDYLRNTAPEKITVVTIRNLNTNEPANITGELSWVCPDVLPTQKRSLTIAKDGVYEKEIARDLLNGDHGITPDKHEAFILVKSDQPISIQIKKEEANPGADCMSAIPFNWVSGNDQAAKDGAVWYVIDLKDAKAVKGKQIRARIINKDGKNAGDLEAYLAPTCPCDVPQQQGVTIAAGASRERVIARSSLENFGDEVWVRINTTVPIHFEAEIEDAPAFEPITACNDAQEFEFNKDYTQTVDTAWYFVKTDLLRQNETLAPKAFLKSLASIDNTIKVEFAYECPVTEAMDAKSTSLTNGASISKLIERSMIDNVANKYAQIWFRVTRSKKGNFQFRVDLVDPNTGDKCEHAIILTTRDTTINQKAGSTLWYRIDRKAFINEHKSATLTLTNMDNTAGRISVAAYSNCGEDPFQTASRDHSAGAVKSKELGSDFFRGFSGDYIYLELTVTQQSKIDLRVADEEPYTGDPNACKNAVDVAPNQEYAQKADTAVWYRVDLNSLRANTVGDGTLIITNKVASEIMLKGELSYECPVNYKMTSKTLKIDANGSYTRLVERASIDALEENEVFVLVTTRPGENITFRFDVQLSKGDDCLNPILFDWENGHIHPAKQDLWYLIELSPTIIPEGKDIELHFENLVDDKTTVAADLFYDCREKAFKSLDYNFKGKADSTRIIDRDLIAWIGWPTPGIYVHYSSSNNTRFWARLVDAEPTEILHDTIRHFVCDGFKFHDSYAGTDHIIDSKVAPYFMWNDTIPFRKGTSLCDSVHHFHLTPIVAPDTTLTLEQLKAIGALPLVARGMAVFADSASLKLKEYFDALNTDSVLTIHNIAWEAKDASGNYDDINAVYPATTFLADDFAGPIELHYVLHVDECIAGSLDPTQTQPLYGRDIKVFPQPKKALEETVAFADTICVGVATQIGQKSYTIVQHLDTAITDKWEGFIAADTLLQPRKVDSTKVYSVVVWKNPDLTQVTFRVPTLVVGQTIDFSKSEADITAELNYARSLNPSIADIKAIGWQTPTPTGYVDYDNTKPIAEGTTSLTLRYFVQTTCDEIINNADSTWQVTENCPTIATTDPITKCAADLPFTWNGLNVTADGGPYVATLPSILNPGCDSTVTLVLTINPIDTVRIIPADAATICAAELPYTWSRSEFAAPIVVNEGGTHRDTIPDLANCKVTIFTLELTVNPIDTIEATADAATICVTELPYTWSRPEFAAPIVINAGGTHHDTIPDLANCKVDVFTLNLTVNDVDTVAAGTQNVTICETELPYNWKPSDKVDLVIPVDAEGTYFDTLPDLANCKVDIFTLNLTVNKKLVEQADAKTICPGDSYDWKDAAGNLIKTVSAADKYEHTVYYLDEAGAPTTCVKEHYELTLSIFAAPDTVRKSDFVCDGEPYEWRDKQNNLIKSYASVTDALKDTVALPYAQGGCDSIVHVLDLSVDKIEVVEASESKVYFGYTYVSVNGRKFVITKDTTIYEYEQNVRGCDSVEYKQKVSVLEIPRGERTIRYTVCAGDTYVAAGGPREITGDSTWVDIVRFELKTPIDSVFTYNIYTYRSPSTLPDTLINSVRAVCGSPLDTLTAQTRIKQYMNDNFWTIHVDTASAIQWFVSRAGSYVAGASNILSGAQGEVDFKVVITDACGQAAEFSKVIPVEDPGAEFQDNILVSKFGQWLLMLHVNNLIKAGYVFTEDDIDWYQIVNGVETKLDNHGYSYTINEELVGSFYVIIHTASEFGCNTTIRSNTISWSAPSNAPLRLVPNIGVEGTVMRLENLNPSNEYQIYGYNESGTLITTMSVSGQAVTEIRAEGSQGLYMLRVVTDDKQETLRYIIK